MVIAIAQEDEDLASHGRMGKSLNDVPFDIVADLGRAETEAWDRTTAYFIDKEGVVRQVFPMIIHARPSWEVVLREMDRILAVPSAKED